MDDLVKDDDLRIRMSSKQRRRLGRASKVVSRQRSKRVKAGTLGRELINEGVDRILAAAKPAKVSALPVERRLTDRREEPRRVSDPMPIERHA